MLSLARKTKKLKSVVKSISFREDIMEYAETMAEKVHGGNLSAFLTTLVSAHKEGIELLMVTRGETVAVVSPNNNDDDSAEEDDASNNKITLDADDLDWIDEVTMTGKSLDTIDDEDDDGEW